MKEDGVTGAGGFKMQRATTTTTSNLHCRDIECFKNDNNQSPPHRVAMTGPNMPLTNYSGDFFDFACDKIMNSTLFNIIIKNCSFCPLKLSLEYLGAVLTRNKKGRYLHLKYLDEYEKCDDV